MNLKENPELIPLIEWWEKHGKKTAIALAAVLVVFCGYALIQKRSATMNANAATAAVSEASVGDLEKAFGDYGSLAAGDTIGLKLAKEYFNKGQYDEAMKIYEELEDKKLDGYAGVPAVGKAYCLEAMGKLDEAIDAFDAFAESNGSSYLALTARISGARCLAKKGDKPGALACLDALKGGIKDDAIAEARIKEAETLINRMK